MPFRLGVDIGGTFTSLVALDERTGQIRKCKVPSTSSQPERGFIECLRRFLRDSKVRSHRIKSILHATTIATNAIIMTREDDRTLTAESDTALKPTITSYLQALQGLLHDEGIDASLYLMQSNGSMTSAQTVIKQPALAIDSGLAAGVIAANFHGEQLAERNIISLDIGGTTAKAGLVFNGEIQVADLPETGGRVPGDHVAREDLVRFPFNLTTIGIGGGSIVWLDEVGELHVGPQSAGADPGPACYGHGGTSPTLTDAHLLLGQLNPRQHLAGGIQLQAKKASDAFKPIAQKLGISVETTALHTVETAAGENIKLLQTIAKNRGQSFSDSLLVAFGGCGPMYASAVARELGIRKILIPPSAGLTAALGLLCTDFILDAVQTHPVNIDEADLDSMELILRRMELRARALLEEEGVDEDDIVHIRTVDMRYAGEFHSLEVTVEGGPLRGDSLTKAVETFHAKHETARGSDMIVEPVEILNLRVKSIGVTHKPSISTHKIENSEPQSSINERREVTLTTGHVKSCPIYERDLLQPRAEINGPAVIEDYDSTILLLEEDRCKVDERLNLIIEVS